MQIRLKQPSSLHRPLVHLRIFSPPFGLGLVVLLVVLVNSRKSVLFFAGIEPTPS